MGELGPFEGVFLAAVMVFYIAAVGVPAAMICRRIGRPVWLGALALIPVLNLALLWFVAISRWDAERANHGAA